MSKKSDALGAGRFGATHGVSARRAAMAAVSRVPTDGVAPPTKLSVDKISLNPDNPRSSLGDLTDLAASLRERGQKVAITVMNRDAYVAANPVREADLEPATSHVVIDGNRRLAAAREAGLQELGVMVDDEQGSTEDEVLESALITSIHRQDLSELDEARTLGRLLGIHKTQSALAKRLHRSQPWVSQRLALLNLTPDLQQRIGQEPIDLLRAVGNKPASEQAGLLEELKRRRAEGVVDRASAKRQLEGEDGAAGQGSDYGVMIEPAEAGGSPGSQTTNRMQPGEGERGSGEADASAGARPGRRGAARRRDADVPGIARRLAGELDDHTFFELVALLNERAQERDPERFAQLLRDCEARSGDVG